MRNLYAPWRMEYIDSPPADGCLFCRVRQAPIEDDRKNLVVHRAPDALVLMNRFPYNNGHLMVAPKAHLPNLEDLPATSANDVTALTQRALRVLREVLSPDGFNLGINAGKIAGAGVADHVHQHIVPRWGGDTNFMPVVGETKILNEHLTNSYQKLRAGFDSLP